MAKTVKAIQLLVNDLLPEDIRDYNRDYKAASINELMSSIHDKYPDKYADIIKEITKIGGNAGYYSGETVALDDLKPPFDRQPYFDQMDKEVEEVKATVKNKKEQANKINAIYAKYADILGNKTMETAKQTDSNLYRAVSSGARGNKTQLRAMITTPALYTDYKGEIIPLFIRKSFGDGVRPVDYLSATYGTRSSTVTIKRATSRSGALGKSSARAVATLLVNKIKDESNNGIDLDISDPSIYGRVLARDTKGVKAGTLLDRDILNYLRKQGAKKLIVHSPIATTSEEGISAEAAGMYFTKKLPNIGDHAGITSAQAIFEPLTQLGLSSKHTAGAYQGKKNISGLAYIEQFLQSPEEFKDKATVAEIDGVVKKIEDAPQGGKYIYINNEKHYVLPDTDIKVKVGDQVEPGDILSDGLADVEDIIRLRGLGEGRRYFSERFKQLLEDTGLAANKKNTEMIARGMYDHVEITDPDGIAGYLPGDIISYNKLEANYKPAKSAKLFNLKNKEEKNNLIGKYLEKPVLHYTIGTKLTKRMVDRIADSEAFDTVLASEEEPKFEPITVRLQESSAKGNQDWLARASSSYLKQNFIDAANKGLDTNVKSNISPYPRMAVGFDFADNIERTGKF